MQYRCWSFLGRSWFCSLWHLEHLRFNGIADQWPLAYVFWQLRRLCRRVRLETIHRCEHLPLAARFIMMVRQLYLVLNDLVIKLVAICEIRHFLSNHIGLCQLQAPLSFIFQVLDSDHLPLYLVDFDLFHLSCEVKVQFVVLLFDALLPLLLDLLHGRHRCGSHYQRIHGR